MTRLTAEIVADARRRCARREATIRQLADEYGVAYGALHPAITGDNWTHLTDPPPVRSQREPVRPPGATREHRLDGRQQLPELWSNPTLTQAQIAESLGVTRVTVWRWATEMGLSPRPRTRKGN